MASSNRHWPSMFKSKPQHLRHDCSSSLISSACRSSPYSSAVGAGCEERCPEPKPRWNPKPEQIRILEAIFNSGMVNPPRDQIRKIRAQLQEYGQVGDANVFYWFQNRKSRSKHKQRQLQNSKQNPPASAAATDVAVAPSFSSSWDKSSPRGSDNYALKIIGSAANNNGALNMSNSHTASVNQTYFQTHNEYLQDPFFFPVPPECGGGGSGGCGDDGASAAGAGCSTQSLLFNDLNNGVGDHPTVGAFPSLFLGEMIGCGSRKEDEETLKFQQELSFFVTNHVHTGTVAPTPAVTFASLPPFQGAGESGGSPRSTVFINDVAFEAPVGPFNVRDTFGDDAVLVTPSGHPVLTNEWGDTIQPLQNGAFYYLVRTLAAPLFAKHDHTSGVFSSGFPPQV
ncbi:hypothetical protein Nepgr_028969 [Nepenthes gracilis]|uniref:Homeobox domain-containing protein n=1 Tax=Nepenthes gracilis TaxID=150966 RepID=A0AAD3TE06_NEPGR|nr:hypothetical protein Nepgr_028969 [Nepenthes gracilis]